MSYPGANPPAAIAALPPMVPKAEHDAVVAELARVRDVLREIVNETNYSPNPYTALPTNSPAKP